MTGVGYTQKETVFKGRVTSLYMVDLTWEYDPRDYPAGKFR